MKLPYLPPLTNKGHMTIFRGKPFQQGKHSKYRYYTKSKDFREVITHVKFPEDIGFREVTESLIKEGLQKSHILDESKLQFLLGHLFTPCTLYQYARDKDIFKTQTILNFPKPMLIKHKVPGKKGKPSIRHYYLAQEVSEYVKYVESLRDDEVLNRPQGNFVVPNRRVQSFVEERVMPQNFKKFKVSSIKDFFENIKRKFQ
jgi:hypothetical protein